MKKIIFGLAALVIVGSGFSLYSTYASAHDNDRPYLSHGWDAHNNHVFNPDHELSQSSCGNHLGRPVVDVTEKVQNDSDSGVAGNYWAFDYFTRHITVWPTATQGTYCAIVMYNGNFYAVPGQIGPGNTPTGALINTAMDQPIHGPMSGGRRATIVGTLLTTPGWVTHGSVGTTNYQCDIDGNCPGLVSWTDKYFTAGYSYNDDWWGWKYNAGSHGTWINAITGNTGNIL